MKIIVNSKNSGFNTFTTENGKNIGFNYKGKHDGYSCHESNNNYAFSEASHITQQMDNCPEVVSYKIVI